MNEQENVIAQAPSVAQENGKRKKIDYSKMIKSASSEELYNRHDRRNAGMRSYNFSRRALKGKTDKYMQRKFYAHLAYEQHKQVMLAPTPQESETQEQEVKNQQVESNE